MEVTYKEVLFNTYCPKCKYKDNPDTEEPCDSCLEHFVNEHSHKPINYKEK